MRELGNINKEDGHIFELVNYLLLNQERCQLVTGDEMANLIIGLGRLHIEHPLVVETLPLYHLPVVYSDA